jgi:hypothetical protein
VRLTPRGRQVYEIWGEIKLQLVEIGNFGWIISFADNHSGAVLTPELPANLAFCNADGMTLYLTP